jgi:hypothetical protein
MQAVAAGGRHLQCSMPAAFLHDSVADWGVRRHEPLAPLVLDRQFNHFVHGLLHDDPVSGGQRHVGIGQILNEPNQLGVEDEAFTVESRELDHGWQGLRFKVQGFRLAVSFQLSA